jgi:hypothetical protein
MGERCKCVYQLVDMAGVKWTLAEIDMAEEVVDMTIVVDMTEIDHMKEADMAVVRVSQ